MISNTDFNFTCCSFKPIPVYSIAYSTRIQGIQKEGTHEAGGFSPGESVLDSVMEESVSGEIHDHEAEDSMIVNGPNGPTDSNIGPDSSNTVTASDAVTGSVNDVDEAVSFEPLHYTQILQEPRDVTVSGRAGESVQTHGNNQTGNQNGTQTPPDEGFVPNNQNHYTENLNSARNANVHSSLQNRNVHTLPQLLMGFDPTRTSTPCNPLLLGGNPANINKNVQHQNISSVRGLRQSRSATRLHGHAREGAHKSTKSPTRGGNNGNNQPPSPTPNPISMIAVNNQTVHDDRPPSPTSNKIIGQGADNSGYPAGWQLQQYPPYRQSRNSIGQQVLDPIIRLQRSYRNEVEEFERFCFVLENEGWNTLGAN
jgi:hypothetical protein